jgi:hypothetical protein
MADPVKSEKKPESKLPKRCAEAVKSARIATAVAAIPPLTSKAMLEVGKEGVEEMAIHPWGLAIVFKGKAYLVPAANVTIVTLAEE